MSTSLPPKVLQKAINRVFDADLTMATEDLVRIAESIEEQGYLIVARADVHALRAAADKVLRFAPATRWPHRFNGEVGDACREPGCGQMISNGAAH